MAKVKLKKVVTTIFPPPTIVKSKDAQFKVKPVKPVKMKKK